jgi:hypothetical protein
MGDAPELVAAKAGGPGAGVLVHRRRLGVREKRHAGTDQRLLADDRLVAHRGVDAEEAVGLDDARAGDDDVRGDHHVVADHGVVADVVPAPDHHVVADLHERLDRVVLQDEAVLAAAEIGERGGARADVADELVAALLGLGVFPRPHPVHALEADREEQEELAGWVAPLELLEGHDGQPEDFAAGKIPPVHREARDLVR